MPEAGEQWRIQDQAAGGAALGVQAPHFAAAAAVAALLPLQPALGVGMALGGSLAAPAPALSGGVGPEVPRVEGAQRADLEEEPRSGPAGPLAGVVAAGVIAGSQAAGGWKDRVEDEGGGGDESDAGGARGRGEGLAAERSLAIRLKRNGEKAGGEKE